MSTTSWISIYSAWLATVPSVTDRLISMHSGWLASEPSVGDWLIAIHCSLLASIPSVADRKLLYTPANWPLNHVPLTHWSLYTAADWPLYLVSRTNLIAMHSSWLASVPGVHLRPTNRYKLYTLQLTGLCTKCHRQTNLNTLRITGLCTKCHRPTNLYSPPDRPLYLVSPTN